MRRPAVFRGSSTQDLCIFCACHLAGDLPPPQIRAPFARQARRIASSNRPSQSASSAASAQPENGNPPSQEPSWKSIAESTLSATEQHEKSFLLQSYEDESRRKREAEDNAKWAHEQRAIEQRARDAQREKARERARREDIEARKREARREGQIQAEERARRTGIDNRNQNTNTQSQTRQGPRRVVSQRSKQSAGAGQDASRGRKVELTAREGKPTSGLRTSFSTPPAADEERTTGPRFTYSSPPAVLEKSTTGPRNRFSALPGDAKPKPKPTPKLAPKPKRSSMPSFGLSSGGTGEKEETKPAGWGFGKTQRAPVEYGTIPEELMSESNVVTRPDPDVSPVFTENAPESEPSPVEVRGSKAAEEVDSPPASSPPKQDARPSTGFGLSSRPHRRPAPPQPQSSLDGLTGEGLALYPDHHLQDSVNSDIASEQQANSVEGPSEPRRKSEAHEAGRSILRGLSRVDRKNSNRPYASQTSTNPEKPWSASTQQHGRDDRPAAEKPPMPPPSLTGDSRYRAVPLDRQDFQVPENNTGTSDNWQHLTRRQSEPSQPPPPVPKQSPSYQDLDGDWVDRHFEMHKQQRQKQAIPIQRSSENVTYRPSVTALPPPDAAPVKNYRRCGRCGQVGHVAKDCTGTKNRASSQAPRMNDVGSSFRLDLGDRRIGRASQPDDEQSRVTDYRRPFGDQDTTPAVRTSKFVDEVEEVVEKPRRPRFAAEEDEDDMEESDDRSSKARKEKNARRGRREVEDEDEEDDRPSRRSRRGFEEDEVDLEAGDRLERKAKKAAKDAQRKADKIAEKREQATKINLPEFVSVSQLAQQLGVRYESLINRLERLGYDDVFPGKILNAETSGMIAMEYDFEPIFETTAPEEDERDLRAQPAVEDTTYLPTRPPVVTIMGHVDHGKTTILDYLRKSSVAAGEAGGITQHIGAFSVPLSSGKTITFLDTPGHAAFLAMRQRGANVTDIVILVVAADDSVKPQTLEAIKHAKGAGVPMIVAVNKIDKEEADVQRVKNDLARHGVEIEDFGGDTQVVLVSGKTGEGMDELEEAAVTLSEILDHRADTDGPVEGWVLEATTRKAGRVATVLVRRGTLKPGSVIVAGKTWARVRTLRNEAGKSIGQAGPGTPVEVDGWRDQATAGDEVLQAPTEQKATAVVEYRLEIGEREKTAQDMEAINEARRLEQEKRERDKANEAAAKAAAKAGDADAEGVPAPRPEPQSTGQMEVPFIIKGDVSGSVEAVSAYIMSVSSPLIAPRILHTAVGPVHESDIDLASAAEGHIISFNLPPNEGTKGQAEARGVKILENNIIYRVLDDVKSVLEDKLPPILSQKVLGEAEVSAAFEISLGGRKKMKIAGCKVRNGVIGRGTRVRITRGSEKIYDGTISSLKNVKKDVQEMRKGTECGMGFDGWEAFEVGDQVQTYQEISEKRSL